MYSNLLHHVFCYINMYINYCVAFPNSSFLNYQLTFKLKRLSSYQGSKMFPLIFGLFVQKIS